MKLRAKVSLSLVGAAVGAARPRISGIAAQEVRLHRMAFLLPPAKSAAHEGARTDNTRAFPLSRRRARAMGAAPEFSLTFAPGLDYNHVSRGAADHGGPTGTRRDAG